MDKTLTIIIPVFNESTRIIRTLNNIDQYILQKMGQLKIKVIIIDDGSTDNTKGTVNSWIQNKSKNKDLFELISYRKNQGKGYAVKEGILKATSELILYTDADGASPIEEFEKLASWVGGFDIVCGSRVLRDKNSNVKMSILRRAIGLVFHLILICFNVACINDTQCGFKLFKTQVAKRLASMQRCLTYAFDIEYLFIAKKFGYKVKEVPVNWYHVKGSKINFFIDPMKMFIDVVKIRLVYRYQ